MLATLYLYDGTSILEDPGAKYGQLGFLLTTFEKVQRWPTFMALNSRIRAGEYAHFLSRSGNPVYSVSYYTTGDRYSYKILYHGSGGGLFLCIADVPPSLKITLRSLVPITASNIIDYCVDYSTDSLCLRCQPGFHLQNKRCYPNYVGCIKYRENICIQCHEFYLLVENGCISDCLSLSDTRSIRYSEDVRASTCKINPGARLLIITQNSASNYFCQLDGNTEITKQFSNIGGNDILPVTLHGKDVPTTPPYQPFNPQNTYQMEKTDEICFDLIICENKCLYSFVPRQKVCVNLSTYCEIYKPKPQCLQCIYKQEQVQLPSCPNKTK